MKIALILIVCRFLVHLHQLSALLWFLLSILFIPCALLLFTFCHSLARKSFNVLDLLSAPYSTQNFVFVIWNGNDGIHTKWCSEYCEWRRRGQCEWEWECKHMIVIEVGIFLWKWRCWCMLASTSAVCNEWARKSGKGEKQISKNSFGCTMNVNGDEIQFFLLISRNFPYLPFTTTIRFIHKIC